VFDGKRWTGGADLPTPREHLAAVSDGEFAYAVGGRELAPDKNLATLERYDPEADSWQALPDMPTARGGLGAVIVGRRVFAVGGESPTGAMREVEYFNLGDKSWSRAPSMRTPRHGLTVEAIGGAFYAIGGATHAGHASAVDDTEVTRLTR
jgi:non-specific serine/threonine protein kinase